MKAGAFLWVLLWFGASIYAGYRLTERSFGWIDQPYFGLAPEEASAPNPMPLNLEALKDRVPPQLLEQAKKLSPQQAACLQASISPARMQAALQGRLTAEEAAAVKKCLE